MDENADGGVVTAVATENASEVTVDNDHFEVADGNLKLKDGNSLDFETDTSPITVTITATSEGGDATATVSVSINDVNEAPTISIADGMTPDGMEVTSTVAENVMGAILGEITLSDEDAGQTHTLMTSDERFVTKQDSEGGWWLALADDASLDFEEGAEVTVTVTVTDSGEPAMSASADVTITVTDVNEGPNAPTVVDADNLSVDENDAGASITSVEATTDPEGDTDITYHVDDSRFEISAGRVLKLKDGMSLNHESESYVMVTVTARDSDGNVGDGTTVTVHVNDVNEGPDVTGTVAAVTANAGADIKADPIDLLALFNDPDEGDAPVRYTMSGNPSWLTFAVEFGEDDDGNETVHGILTGRTPAGDDSVNKVTLTASDGDGASGSVEFYVISDDGNDDITDVDLIDSSGNVAVEADVDENDASGVVLGEIRVSDQDHAMHPNGMHLIQILRGDTDSKRPDAPVDNRFEVKYDEAGVPWLVLKEGMSLDHETDDGIVDLTIRAVDMNGATNKAGNAFTGSIEFQTVTIVVNDQNDAPQANTIGNWWVTAEDRQRSDEVAKGGWLDFSLETAGDMKGEGAFWDPDGDTLTYTLSAPSILEIDEDSGRITNTKGGVPIRGVHRLTVTATDPDGETATASFYLSIALSGPDNSFQEDNDEPRIRVTSEVDYVEGSGDRRVATFTVTDDDNDLGHHPFAIDPMSVMITSVVDDDDQAANDAGVQYASTFKLSDPIKNGDTWTYHVYVRDTNPSPTVDSRDILDYEEEDIRSLTITVSATDGVDLDGNGSLAEETVTATIDIKVDNANEKPEAGDIGGADGTTNIGGGTYAIAQSEAAKKVLYIKLEELWSDAEDDPDDLTFGASVSGSWIKILHGPAEWRDIEDGPDGDDGTADDVDWPDGSDPTNQIVVGDDAAAPAAGEQVVIIEIDRTGRNNGQDDEGSFTLTATDDGRPAATGSKTYKITPTDQNLHPVNAVSLNGSPREDATLRASFNDNRDPDLAGSVTPALVIYQWYQAEDEDGTGEELVSQGTGNTYRLTQADVGSYITVKVKYFEVFQGLLVDTEDGDTLNGVTVANEATTSRAVTDTPDKGRGVVTVTADGNALTVTNENLLVTDGDYETAGNVVADTADGLTVTWEMSDNGRGGWEPAPADATPNDNSYTLDDGKGKYYRAVITYDANGVDDGETGLADDLTESIYSDAIRIADVRDTAAATPPVPTGSAFPGGTLSVNLPNTSVQWQMLTNGNWMDIPGATGSLSLTQAHAGDTIRALVSYHSTDSDNPGLIAIVPTAQQTVGGAATTFATPARVKDHDIEVSVMGTGHGPRGVIGVSGETSNNAGHNLSHTEIVPLASLFQDPDSARLTYTVSSVGDGLTAVTPTPTGSTTYVYDGDSAVGGVLTFEADTGKLTFNSDLYQAHDGDAADGDGNVLTLTITATDESGTRSATTDVNLRINVAPTGIIFNDAADGNGTAGAAISVPEEVGPGAGAPEGGTFIARVDVQDQNQSGDSSATPPVRPHKFGTHEVTISGDDRFEITNSGNGKTDGDGDGSTWEVRLKKGAKLDFETDGKDLNPAVDADGDGTPNNDKQIELTLTATDGGGLSTPSGPGTTPIKLVITITNVTSDDPPASTPTDVPGLDDNETTDPDDERVDDNTDTDTDGGAPPPPPPGMSLGQIEDFVDNMDVFEQDLLLEDFMLVIDDGIEIA